MLAFEFEPELNLFKIKSLIKCLTILFLIIIIVYYVVKIFGQIDI